MPDWWLWRQNPNRVGDKALTRAIGPQPTGIVMRRLFTSLLDVRSSIKHNNASPSDFSKDLFFLQGTSNELGPEGAIYRNGFGEVRGILQAAYIEGRVFFPRLPSGERVPFLDVLQFLKNNSLQLMIRPQEDSNLPVNLVGLIDTKESRIEIVGSSKESERPDAQTGF